MYMDLLKRTVDSTLVSKRIQCEISAKMDFDQATTGFNFIEVFSDENDLTTLSSSPAFSMYFSDRTKINFTFVDRAVKLSPSDKTLKVFMMNSDLRKIKVDFIQVRIYEITD